MYLTVSRLKSRGIVKSGVQGFSRDALIFGFNLNSVSKFQSSTIQKIGSFEYEHSYGSILGVGIRSGAKISDFELGVKFDLSLANSYSVKGSNFDEFDTGRFRTVTFGPELAYNNDAIRAALGVSKQRIDFLSPDLEPQI